MEKFSFEPDGYMPDFIMEGLAIHEIMGDDAFREWMKALTPEEMDEYIRFLDATEGDPNLRYEVTRYLVFFKDAALAMQGLEPMDFGEKPERPILEDPGAWIDDYFGVITFPMPDELPEDLFTIITRN